MRYLFRFRDLVASTISAHREVLAVHDYVWWGWWKRPTEDARQTIWTAMQKALAQGEPLEVGLFDSGSGQVFRAKVAAVRPPADDGPGVPISALPEDQRDKIPAYYRESPFSRAWLKLIEIGTEPIDFFDRYSLAEPPPLRQFDAALRLRLRGKVITGADELREMDTTIWEVRPREFGDHDESIILGRAGVHEPISREPIRLKSNVVLHLTDLHFAAGDHRHHHGWRLEGESGRTLADAVIAALKKKKIEIGAIIVTGDLTFLGSEEEFKAAHASLGKLMGVLDLGPESIVVVPGNHDIQWSTDATYADSAPIVNAPPEARANYARFYRSLYKHDANDSLSMGRRFVLPSGLTLEIAALNSSSLQTGKKFLAGMGRIDTHALEDISLALQWVDHAPSLAMRLLALHHHVVLTEDFEPAEGFYRGFGIAVDAPRVQRMAARRGVQLVLHGHKHRAFLWKSGVFSLPEEAQEHYRLGELSVIGGGSAGSTEVEASSNYFNTIEFKPEHVELSLFRSKRTEPFEGFQRWRAPLVLQQGSLVLGEWDVVVKEKEKEKAGS